MKLQIVIDAEITPQGQLRFNINGVKSDLTMVNGTVKVINQGMHKMECVAHAFDILKAVTLSKVVKEQVNEEINNNSEPVSPSGIITSSG